jgi:hypothetical protein
VALLDQAIESGRVLEAAPRGHAAGLLGEVATLHSALPFAEVERRLIVELYDELSFPSGLRDDVRKFVPRQKVCVEGIVRATSGRELMERWWSWRRGVDDYQGGVGLEAAREAVYAAYEHLAA